MPSIHVLTGNSKGEYFPVADEPLTIGRGDMCNVQLRDERISRQHALICFNGETYAVKDLKSANGVYVNGLRITTETNLEHNDTILIGESKMLFSIQSENDIGTVAEQ
ncbi:MAG: FHA domain-containing protein [Planctomycetota bacterium]